LKTQNVVNAAWAFTTANHLDGELCTALAITAERRLNELKSQSVANTAWALATVNYRDERLFAVLARATTCLLNESKPQERANTAWAFATANHCDKKLFAAWTIVAELVQVAECCQHSMGVCISEIPR